MTELAEIGGDPDGTLLRRLFRAFARQLDGFEAKMADMLGSDGVKELTALAKTLESLLGLYGRAAQAHHPNGMDVAEARAELLNRMQRIAQPSPLAAAS